MEVVYEQATTGRRSSKIPEKKKNNQPMIWKIARIWIICILIALGALAALAVKRVVIPIASMYKEAVEMVSESNENTFKAEQTSIVYDRNGNELKKLKGEKDVHYLEYEDIPDAAKLAIISVEDKKFTTHRGIDMQGIARAVLALIRNKGEITQGASTVTQQLARNIFLSFETTYSRKIQEMFVAVALEQKYTKEQIMEFYLNNVYFSNGYYGIESASEAYFRKDVNELTISQIAFLCAIPNSPTRFDPYDHPEATMERRNKILKCMYEDGYISKEQYDASMAEEIQVEPKKKPNPMTMQKPISLNAPQKVSWKPEDSPSGQNSAQRRKKKNTKKNMTNCDSSCKKSLYTAGYRIYTSIDMQLQSQLQTSVLLRVIHVHPKDG